MLKVDSGFHHESSVICIFKGLIQNSSFHQHVKKRQQGKFCIRNTRSVEHESSYMCSYVKIKEDFFFALTADDVISTVTDPSALCCSSEENVRWHHKP